MMEVVVVTMYRNARARLLAAVPGAYGAGVWVLLTPTDVAAYLTAVLLSDRVPGALKSQLGLAGLYAWLGIDLVPEEFAGPIGLVDDSIVLLVALDRAFNGLDPELVQELWPGEPEALVQVQGAVRWLSEHAHATIVRPLGQLIRQAFAMFRSHRSA